MNNVTTGQVSIFPQGYIHFQQNLGCKPAKFIAALSSEDPGLTNSFGLCLRLKILSFYFLHQTILRYRYYKYTRL